MKLVTAEQMANIDRRTIEGEGIPGIELMEKAGRGVFDVAKGILGEVRDRKATVVCGRGNNGGDGFVVARLLKEAGAKVSAFLLARREDVKGDALTNLRRAQDLSIGVVEVLDEDGVSKAGEGMKSSDIIVDAIFGTGIRGGVRGLAARMIDTINACDRPVVSVDVPSGLEVDTGRAEGACVQARATVTFGLPKIGQFLYPGKAKSGVLRVVDIGIPPNVIEEEPCSLHLITSEDVGRLLPARPPDVHKGMCGRVVIIAGSVGMTGAATLASQAAMRMGAGLVTLGIPESLNDIMEVKLTEVMTKPLPEVRKRRCLSLRAVGEIRRMLEGADCLALGPGLSRYRETAELIRRIVSEVKVPTVIDADGLNALGERPSLLRGHEAPLVVTPHPGEFARLTGASVDEVVSDPVSMGRGFSQDFGVTVVLKGAPTIVATREGEVFVNSTGNAGMATGGSGDVLTGAIVALIGQGIEPSRAAIAAVYLHSLAGDLARDQEGELGLVAGDILNFLPAATRMTDVGCQILFPNHRP